MLNLTKKSNFFIVAAFLVMATSCKNEVLPSCEGIHWTYEGEEGPDHWGELCVDYTPCGGQVQSPVNIAGAVDDAALMEIAKTYSNTATHILNNGHTIQFTADSGSSIVLNGETYNLLQFHFHTHSEHTVGGTSYPMEAHFVHKNEATGKLVVIGVLFEEGSENGILAPFIDHLPETADATYDAADTFNPADLLPAEKSYFTYAGSLTTPPCSEIVTWIVMEHPIMASHDQILHIEELEHENNRPIQALEGRVIKHFNG